MKRILASAIATTAITVAVDQSTKGLASLTRETPAFETIGNDSTLLGVVPLGGTPLLAVATATALVCAYIGWQLVRTGRLHPVVLGLLVGGGIGNLVDRAFLGYVRDFLWILGIVINVADVAIVLGVIAFLSGVYRTATPRQPPAESGSPWITWRLSSVNARQVR